jgi:phosphohistidine swiveling domain-containing protein
MSCESPFFISSAVPLAEISRTDAGGKGWALSRLRERGFAVPPWVVVSSRLFDTAAADGSLDAWEWPGPLERELCAIAERVGAGSTLAVRSSAVCEDSAEHSFAGILESILNVAPADVPAAVRRVWASALSERAQAYRCRKGLGVEAVSMGVVVQAMLPAAVSGVLFTRDAADFGPRSTIAAGLGLGEGVVTDAVETDTYRVPHNSDRIEKDVRRKRFQIVPAPSGGTHAEVVPRRLQTRSTLTNDQVLELRDLGLRLEKVFGRGQDIEWAFDREGRLFVLQARPIVGPASRVARGKRRVWDNANVVESYPGLTLPLTFSFGRRAYERTFRRAARGFLPLTRAFEGGEHVFENLVGLVDGRVYYNLLAWYALFSHLPGPDRYVRSWDRMMGVEHGGARPSVRVGPLVRLLALLCVARVLLKVEANARAFARRFETFYAAHEEGQGTGASADALVTLYRSLEEEVSGFWYRTLYNDFCAIKYAEWLSRLCTRWELDGQESALLPTDAALESVAPVSSLVTIGDMIRREPLFCALFQSRDDPSVWQRIAEEAQYAPLKAAFHAHLHAFGDRGIEELKLETATFREEPWRLVGLVRHYCETGLSARGIEARGAETRVGAARLIESRLPNPLKRLVLGFVLARARAAIRHREGMRLARSRLFGIVRRLARQLGDSFAEQGLLNEGRDVFYLTLEEALGVVEGTNVTGDLKGLVELRKKDYTAFARHDPPERLETVGIPCLGQDRVAAVVGNGARLLWGTGCSVGRASGTAKVVANPRDATVGRTQILVARSTDPGWVFLMIGAGGMVVERGSPLSHTAIIGRELGIPTVVGAKGATQLIPDGSAIAVDGSTGEVRWS